MATPALQYQHIITALVIIIWCNCSLNAFGKQCIHTQIGDTIQETPKFDLWLHTCIESYGENIEQNQHFYCFVNIHYQQSIYSFGISNG